MPRYFFNVRGCTDIPDPTGTELRDLDAAGQETARIASEILPMLEPELGSGRELMIEVADAGEVVLTMTVLVRKPGASGQMPGDNCSQEAAQN